MHRAVIAAALLVLAAPVNAQQTAPAPAAPAPAAPAPAAPAAPAATPAPAAKSVVIPGGFFPRGQTNAQYSAKERLIGAKVQTKGGEIIGDIEDLILKTDGNAVEVVIIGVGGILGVGEKKIGVNYSKLQFGTKDGNRTITLDTTKEVLAQLQPYKYAEPPKTMLQKATEASKAAAKKAGEVTKGAVDKAKEAVKGKAEAPKQP